MKLVKLIPLILVVTCAMSVEAAQFNVENGTLRIVGPIVTGDYKTLTARLSTNDELRGAFFSYIAFNSQGGDVGEAMKIANLIRHSFTSTAVEPGDACESACVLLWAGGVNRHLLGKLGFHRITVRGDSINVGQAERRVGPVAKTVESYLLDMGIPRTLVDKMNETSSSDMFYIDGHRVKEDQWSALNYRPAYIDAVTKKCGPDPIDAANKTGVRLSKDEMQPWLNCEYEVRRANQILNVREVMRLVKTSKSSD